MRAPPIPHTEPQRLRRLRATGLLDTDAEERFDRITRIAQRSFDVPIALVSLVDEHRQWFKSRQGLDAQQTPRNVSFCGHAILEREILCVEDAFEDPRFSDNPLVLDGPQVRFYAGCPLFSEDGYALGTLCVIDSEPRQFSDEDRRQLADIAALAEVELRRSTERPPERAHSGVMP